MDKTCIYCEISFKADSRRKRDIGGKINECPDCVEEMGLETAIAYAGVQAGDGKGVGCTIVAFGSEKDRANYVKAWRANSGQNVGKQCQIGSGTIPMTGMKFRKVGESGSIGTNHKGRM